MLTCPACGAESPNGLTFCGQCGAALATPPPIAEERKVVTTPFCGLVGFTAMSEAADSEEIDALLGRAGTADRDSSAQRLSESVGRRRGVALVDAGWARAWRRLRIGRLVW